MLIRYIVLANEEFTVVIGVGQDILCWVPLHRKDDILHVVEPETPCQLMLLVAQSTVSTFSVFSASVSPRGSGLCPLLQ